MIARSTFVRLAAMLACVGLPFSLTSAVRAADAPVTIRIAIPGQDVDAQAWYAQDTGIFKKYGINVDITIIRRGGGAAVVAAIAGNAADIGDGDIVSVATAHEKGIPISLLAPAAIIKGNASSTQLIVPTASPIKTAKDFEGKTIALISLAGPSRIAINAWLEAGGASLDKVTFVELPPINMAAAVDRGTVAGAVINEPALTASQTCCRAIGNIFASVAPEWMLGAWYATPDWIAKNPDLAKKFVQAMREAAIWGNNPANHQRSGEILNMYTPFPPDILPRMTRATYGDVFNRKTMQPLLDAAYKYKALKTPVKTIDLLSPVAIVQ